MITVVVAMLAVGVNVIGQLHLMIVLKMFQTVNGFIQKNLDIFKLFKNLLHHKKSYYHKVRFSLLRNYERRE